jgi:CubicO group peptidase (beta-lactamase class C family)
MRKDTLYTLILVILWVPLLYSCLPEGEYKIEMNFEPPVMSDGWEISDPASQGIDPDRLGDVYAMMFDHNKFLTSRSLLIVRNGKLVSESYFRDRNDLYRKSNIRGITKCITSVLAGFAWDLELFRVEDTLYRYIPGYFDGDRNKRDITLGHVLTMRTGLEWDDDTHTVGLFSINKFPSTMRYVITKPLLIPVGSGFSCNYGTPQLAMGVTREVLGMESTDSLINKLFGPLGINDFVWENHSDGLHFGGAGLHLKPRDLARLGQFCLQKGSWAGQQIVSESWMDTSSSPILGPEITGSSMHYGYYWWVHPVNNAFFGKGAGGQYLYIVPAKELVIVHTANSSSGSGYEGITLEEFLSVVEMILGAME